MMEKNKVREMTPEVKEKYEKKKTIWLQKRREKEEQLKAEAAEKLRRNKQMMNEEIRCVHIHVVVVLCTCTCTCSCSVVYMYM